MIHQNKKINNLGFNNIQNVYFVKDSVKKIGKKKNTYWERYFQTTYLTDFICSYI